MACISSSISRKNLWTEYMLSMVLSVSWMVPFMLYAILPNNDVYI